MTVPEWLLTDAWDVTGPNGRKHVTVHTVKDIDTVMVCSHDCDCDPKNISGRAGVLVAPVLPRPRLGDDPDRILALRNSWRRTPDGDYDFGHLFPVLDDAAQEPIEFDVVDFSRMISAGPGVKGLVVLKKRKTREMRADVRVELQLKLAAFLGRGQ